MHDVLAWLESSALGAFMRDTGPWTYPIVNLIHILGVATLFGAVLILDLRLLGLWRRVPLRAITSTASPVATAGFVVAALSGPCLLASNALDYDQNPVLLVKFGAIGLGMVNVVLLRRTSAWRAHTTGELSHAQARLPAAFAGVSLASWLTAVTAGRMLGYW
ncbi:hypothetical protein AFM11_24100 [Mycolicibacterium wolinskyi]|uniref:DUF6644 domain-containing protein n=1 Tax=Mycolicibacterium wolinskyi TaxID=59750 RepID=A0A132PH08_9MYCO|nr:DUF6644 family protein [Mycolicibacterium wolinskyi]KWX21616.1 hypothetical protein AFM11_24100 [Mycolicibacterium wolinskyi]